MFKLFQKMRKNKKGFTLTELIVVVAILGVLAVIATPIIGNQLNNARTNGDLATARTLNNALSIAIAEGDAGVTFIAGTGAIDSSTTALRDGIRAAINARVAGATLPVPSVEASRFFLTTTAGNFSVTVAANVASTATVVNLNLAD